MTTKKMYTSGVWWTPDSSTWKEVRRLESVPGGRTDRNVYWAAWRGFHHCWWESQSTLQQWFSNVSMHVNHPGRGLLKDSRPGPTPRDSDSVGLSEHLTTCISNKFSGAADAAGWGPHLADPTHSPASLIGQTTSALLLHFLIKHCLCVERLSF